MHLARQIRCHTSFLLIILDHFWMIPTNERATSPQVSFLSIFLDFFPDNTSKEKNYTATLKSKASHLLNLPRAKIIPPLPPKFIVEDKELIPCDICFPKRQYCAQQEEHPFLQHASPFPFILNQAPPSMNDCRFISDIDKSFQSIQP